MIVMVVVMIVRSMVVDININDWPDVSGHYSMKSNATPDLLDRKYEKDLSRHIQIALNKLREEDPAIELHYAEVCDMHEYDIFTVTLGVWKPNLPDVNMDYEDGWIEVVMVKTQGTLSDAHVHACICTGHHCRN